MSKMKTESMLFAFVLAVSLFAGCGNTEQKHPSYSTDSRQPAAESYMIGVTMESLEAFLGQVADGLMKFDDENDDVVIIILDAKYNISTQLQQVENFIAQKMDAVIIKCVDKDATEDISEICQDAGVKLVAVNVDINSHRDVYVGSNHKLSGVLETEYIAELLGGEGKVAVLMGDPSHAAAQNRTDGTKEVIDKYPDMEIVDIQSGMWDRSQGMSIAENWIKSDMEIDAIIGNNDEMVIGAQIAYELYGITDVVFGGIDGTQDSLELLKDGKISVTVFQNGFQQGYKAAESAYKLIIGETVLEYVDVPYELVKPEQADEYLSRY